MPGQCPNTKSRFDDILAKINSNRINEACDALKVYSDGTAIFNQLKSDFKLEDNNDLSDKRKINPLTNLSAIPAFMNLAGFRSPLRGNALKCSVIK